MESCRDGGEAPGVIIDASTNETVLYEAPNDFRLSLEPKPQLRMARASISATLHQYQISSSDSSPFDFRKFPRVQMAVSAKRPA